jgi:hypothetical protein
MSSAFKDLYNKIKSFISPQVTEVAETIVNDVEPIVVQVIDETLIEERVKMISFIDNIVRTYGPIIASHSKVAVLLMALLGFILYMLKKVTNTPSSAIIKK